MRAVVNEARARAGVETSLDGGASVGETSNLGIGSPAGMHATLDAGIGISYELNVVGRIRRTIEAAQADADAQSARSEEHTSELQSLMRISYAVVCLKQKKSTHK